MLHEPPSLAVSQYDTTFKVTIDNNNYLFEFMQEEILKTSRGLFLQVYSIMVGSLIPIHEISCMHGWKA